MSPSCSSVSDKSKAMAADASIWPKLMSDEFGRYRLESKIGEGGLAEVYRAQTSDGATVALKRLSRVHLGSQGMLEVFANEAKVAKLAQAPALLGAVDVGNAGGWPFFVMPLAEGGSLQDRLDASTALPRAELGALAMAIAAAVESLHKTGFVHGDLSPGNILFDAAGTALLGDFSAATPLGAKQRQPQGTFAYMSPEQVRGQPLDARSDVFSLGALLWECASGQKVFWREEQHLCFMAVVESQPPAMPPGWEAAESVLRQALAKEPMARYSEPEEFCSALAAAL